MRAISRDNHFGVSSHSGEKHFDLSGGGVLRLVKDYNRLVERSAAHESQRRDLNDVRLHIVL